jgi:hypothetical protein
VGNAVAVVLLLGPTLRSAFNELLVALCFFDTLFLVSSITSAAEALGVNGRCARGVAPTQPDLS